MPALVIGPLLRYVGQTDATVWVETSAACEVDVLGHTCPTFEIEGHHYALVHVEGLDPGSRTEYRVELDGERVWPSDDEEFASFPPSVIRTLETAHQDLRVAFGSCRVSLPHHEPYVLATGDHEDGHEMDALYALAIRMRDGDERWPDILMLLGDQVYADEGALDTRDFIRSRRDVSAPPHEEIADFEEYCRLYQESWSHPVTRWLLSTVPTAMIFDDHDVRDDWNISHSWVKEMRATTWWDDRIVSAFMSYWIYQHLGNLAPGHLHEDEMWDKIRTAEGDAGPLLREFAFKADRSVDGTRWSYCRDLGSVRLLVMDSRAGRVLDPGRRQMVDDEEWAWIEEHAHGDFDHLLIGSSLPILLGPGLHHLEAWNEATAEGAWGKRFAKLAEKLRRGVDMEHWAAFNKSFRRVEGLLREAGQDPATIVMLGGDVHHAYLAEAHVPGARSRIYQAVCSPFRNPLSTRERMVIRVGVSKAAGACAHFLARRAGVPDPVIGWDFVEGPVFDNQLATLDLEGRKASMKVEKTEPGDEDAKLTVSFERSLTS